MKEIGSEYWLTDFCNNDNNLDFFNIGKDYKLLMSGRTAIDFVLKDIGNIKKIVYMPNYCCESMIKPFLKNNYKVFYYNCDMINNKYDIDIDFDCGIFFAMSYFGYSKSNMDYYIEKFNNKNVIVIEDITHRLLCDKNYCEKSSYLIASLRKWFPIISGGLAISIKNEFKNSLKDYIVDDEFVDMKLKAMKLKRDYIDNKINSKEEFLELFSKANHIIENYENKKIDELSIEILDRLDIKKIKKVRIENCIALEKKIKNLKNIRLLYEYKKGDCPLFVPIILNNRDNIRKEAINNSIYLPIHWPNNLKINNDIYNKELSLVIDQRYNMKDVEKYIDKIKEIIGDENE